MNKTTIIPTILLLFAAVTTSWYTVKWVKASEGSNRPLASNPDSFVVNATYLQMNKDGSIHSVMHTPKLIHYSFEDSATFIKPTATISNSKQSPWTIAAQSGSSSHGSNIIHLTGSVILHQAQSKNNRELTITAPYATIYLKKKYAKTSAQVVIKQPRIRATAIGANADFNANTVNLLTKVREISTREQQPAYLNSDSAHYDRNNHISIYNGNVYFHQGSTKLTAQKLLAYDDAKIDKVNQIIATGKRAYYSTLPQHKKYVLNAKANMIKYYPQKGLAVLRGQGEITQHEDKFTGPYIVYNSKQQTITAIPTSHKQTTIIIQP